MFRSRKFSQSATTVQTTSSLSSGNASIKRPAVVTHNDERQKQYTATDPDQINHNKIIDLQAPQQQPDLTIESMSAVLAAAVQMSFAGGPPSSLSLGRASILQPFSKPEKTNVKRRFSARLFMNPWKKSSTVSTSLSAPNTPGLESSFPFDSTSDDDASSRSSSISGPRTPTIAADDGRDELSYRGIQIKEIKTTLKTLVISDQERYPMPEIRLERPGFARINY